MATDLDLGNLVLESNVSGLQLQLASVAQFAPSAKDEIDRLRERLTTDELSSNSKGRPWIYRGIGLRFEISLRIESGTESCEQQTLIEDLSTRLRSAMLWKQLSLHAVSVETSVVSDDLHLVKVFVQQSLGDDTSKRKLHKLEVDVPAQDVKPPPGAPTAALDAVHLDMCIQQCVRKKRRRFQKLDSNARKQGPAESFVSEPDGVDGLYHQLLDGDVEDLLDMGVYSIVSGVPYTVDRQEDVLLDFDNPIFSQGSCSTNGAPTLLKRASSPTDLATASNTHHEEAILELIDAAIRLAISDTPTKLARGVSVVETSPLKRLSIVAPSLWSPGHLKAVASRAVFVPTISCALQNVCGTKAKSYSLRHKGRKLSNSENMTQPMRNRDVHTNSDANEQLNVVSVRLWEVLESGLFDPKAARRLKSINRAAQPTTTERNFLDELLDSSQESQRAASLSGMADNDLLSDADCEDFDYDFGDELLTYELDDSGYLGSDGYKLSPDDINMDIADLLPICTMGTGEDLEVDYHVGRDETDIADQDSLSVCSSLSSLSFPEIEAEYDEPSSQGGEMLDV